MFSLTRRKTTPHHQPPQQSIMQFGYRQLPVLAVRPVSTPVIQPQDSLPKMKWGRPIWTFFHVMAQKVKPEYFNLIIKDFMKYILLICGTLPCPICSTHAIEYMRAININNIRFKDDLINLFYNFHNVVNQRKGYAVLQKEQIPKYETANTIISIKEFVRAFEDKTRSMKLMADDIARSRISSEFKFWINENIKYFDP